MGELSNYERVFEHFRKAFLEADHVAAAEKLHLAYDDERLLVPLFHRNFAVDRRTGDISSPIYREGVPCTERLLILHHLCFYQPEAENAGEMVSFRELRACAVFEPAYRRGTLEPFAAHFSGRRSLLEARAREIGGRREDYGDVAFTFDAFPLVQLRYVFWDADEELPASANILFDRNICRFVHPESVPGLAGLGADLLMGGREYLRKSGS